MMEESREYISYDIVDSGDEFLAHHGVLGMKWGIRKDGKPQGWQGGTGNKKESFGKVYAKNLKQYFKNPASLYDFKESSLARYEFKSKKNSHNKNNSSKRSYVDIMDPTGDPNREEFNKTFPKDKNLEGAKLEWMMDKYDIADEIDYKYAEKFDFEDVPYPDDVKELKSLSPEHKQSYKSMLKELDASFKARDSKTLKELDSIKDETLSKSDKSIKDQLREEIIRDSEDWNDMYSEAMKALEHSRKDLVEMDNNEDRMIHSINAGNEFLMHFGVKGMKWHQHKKQNNIASGVLSGMGYRAPNDARAHGLAKLHYTLNTKHGIKGKIVSKAISNQYQKGVRHRQRRSVARSKKTMAIGSAAMTRLVSKSLSSTVTKRKKIKKFKGKTWVV